MDPAFFFYYDHVESYVERKPGLFIPLVVWSQTHIEHDNRNMARPARLRDNAVLQNPAPSHLAATTFEILNRLETFSSSSLEYW